MNHRIRLGEISSNRIWRITDWLLVHALSGAWFARENKSFQSDVFTKILAFVIINTRTSFRARLYWSAWTWVPRSGRKSFAKDVEAASVLHVRYCAPRAFHWRISTKGRQLVEKWGMFRLFPRRRLILHRRQRETFVALSKQFLSRTHRQFLCLLPRRIIIICFCLIND